MAKNQIGGLIILSFFCLLQISKQQGHLTDPGSNNTTTGVEKHIWSEVEKIGVNALYYAQHSRIYSQYLVSLNGKQKKLASSWFDNAGWNLAKLLSSNFVVIPSEEFIKENLKHEGFFNVYLTPEKKFAKKLWVNMTALNSNKDDAAKTFVTICALPGIEPNIVKYLMDSGIDVNVKSGTVNATALLSAANTGNLPVVKFLVENGATIDAAIELPLGQRAGKFFVKYILIFSKTTPSLSENSKFIITPLNAAVSEMNIDVIKYLLEKGADVNVRNTTWTMYLSPLIADSQDSLFHLNISQELLSILLKHGLNVNGTDPTGQTMLHKTGAKGDLPMSKLVLQYNADVTATDHFGWTPLHFAALYARNDSKQLIQLLLDKGGDINAKTDGGFSPLNLLEAGSDLTFLDYLFLHLPLKSTSERKGIRLSEKDSRVDIVRLFLQRGADPNHQDDILGWSTLHWAAAIGDNLVWKLLVEEYGASTTIKSKMGWTPSDTAKYFDL